MQEFSNQKKHAQASLAEESVLRDQLLHMSEVRKPGSCLKGRFLVALR